MRFFWNNLIDAILASAVSPNSENVNLRARNLQNELKTKVWRTKSAPTGLTAADASGGTLAATTTYYYKITYYDAAGDSIASAEASDTTTASNKTINLSWTAVSGATGYKIYRSTSAGSYGATSYLATTTSTSYSDTGAVALTSGTPNTVEDVIFDLGSATAATSAIIFAHTLTASDSGIVLRASTDNFSASDVLVGTFTYSSGPMLLTFSSASYRYWKLQFTKSAVTETRDIGRFFLGTYTEILSASSGNPLDYDDGYSESQEDLSKKQKSVGGQTYVDVRSTFHRFKLKSSYMTQANRDLLVTMSDSMGEHTSFFVQVDTASPLDTVRYVKQVRMVEREIAGFDSEHAWDVTLELEEQL